MFEAFDFPLIDPDDDPGKPVHVTIHAALYLCLVAFLLGIGVGFVLAMPPAP